MLTDEEITFKKLETFLAFMRIGNLVRAVVEPGTSNVSVHRTIHSLGSALRYPLFEHEGRNLTPLEGAYALKERMQKLVQEVLDTVCLTRRAIDFSAEHLKLGMLYSLTVETMLQLIMDLKLRRSALNADLILGSNVDLFYQLENMELDTALVSLNNSVSDPDYEQLPLLSDGIFLAVPVDSPYVRLVEIDLSTLCDTSLVTLAQGFATHQDGTRVFQQASFEPQIVTQMNDTLTLPGMVSSGVGHVLLPKHIEAAYENRVWLAPLQPHYRLQWHTDVVFLKAKERDPSLLTLLAEYRTYSLRLEQEAARQRMEVHITASPLTSSRPSPLRERVPGPARSPNQAAHTEI